MSIDLSKLSAKELFELAHLKEQEEQRQAELNEHLNKLKQLREELLAKFKKALSKLDDEIKQLQQQREKLLGGHENELERLDKEIANANQQAQADTLEPPTPASKPVPPPVPQRQEALKRPAQPSKPAAAPAPSPEPPPSADRQPPENVENIDDMYIKIRELTRTREYISETLLKEKLKGMGFSNITISKGLEQLIKDKRLIHKGGGSYVLGKK